MEPPQIAVRVCVFEEGKDEASLMPLREIRTGKVVWGTVSAFSATTLSLLSLLTHFGLHPNFFSMSCTS